jgi:hypothetical protein
METEIPSLLKRWEIMRAKGEIRFIVVRGVLVYGGMMFIFALLFDLYEGQALTLHSTLRNAYIWAVAGSIFGFIQWHILERKYKKFAASKSA